MKLKRKPRERVSAPLGELPIVGHRVRLFDPEFTTEKGQKVIAIIKKGAHAEIGAALAGVTRRILEDWLREGAQLIELCPDGDISHLGDRERALCQFVLDVEKALADSQVENIDLIRSARGRWWQAAAWLLERRFPASWGKHEKVTHENKTAPSTIDAKILIASPEGVKAIGEVLRALADQQEPIRRGPSASESRRLGAVRQLPDVEILSPPTPAESIPVGSGSRKDQEADRLDST